MQALVPLSATEAIDDFKPNHVAAEAYVYAQAMIEEKERLEKKEKK